MSWWKRRTPAPDPQLPVVEAAIRALAVECLGLVGETAGPVQSSEDLIRTRAGGLPYAEAGEEWPVGQESGRPLDFVVQISREDSRYCRGRPPALFTLYVDWFAKLFRGDVPEGAFAFERDPTAPAPFVVREYPSASVERFVAMHRPVPASSASPTDANWISAGARVQEVGLRTETLSSYPPTLEAAARCNPGLLDLIAQTERYRSARPRDRCAIAADVYDDAVQGFAMAGDELVGGYEQGIWADSTAPSDLLLQWDLDQHFGVTEALLKLHVYWDAERGCHFSVVMGCS